MKGPLCWGSQWRLCRKPPWWTETRHLVCELASYNDATMDRMEKNWNVPLNEGGGLFVRNACSLMEVEGLLGRGEESSGLGAHHQSLQNSKPALLFLFCPGFVPYKKDWMEQLLWLFWASVCGGVGVGGSKSRAPEKTAPKKYINGSQMQKDSLQ